MIRTDSKVHSVNLDADESVFFLRQLEHIQTKLLEIEYPEYKARAILPIDTEADPADERITYRMYDKVGSAKLIRDYSRDLPRVDVLGKEYTAIVQSLGDSFGYSIQELRAARKTGYPLEARKANAAKEAALREENRLALFGDSDAGLVGFLAHPNATQLLVPADGTGGSTLWKDKTPEQVLRDLNNVTTLAVDLTNGVEIPDTLLLPIAAYTLVSTKKLGIESETILSFFLKASPYVKNVETLVELKGAGNGGTNRAVCYKRDPMKLAMQIPQDFEMFPPQEKGLEFEVPCHSRFGGVIVYKPLSIVYADGI